MVFGGLFWYFYTNTLSFSHRSGSGKTLSLCMYGLGAQERALGVYGLLLSLLMILRQHSLQSPPQGAIPALHPHLDLQPFHMSSQNLRGLPRPLRSPLPLLTAQLSLSRLLCSLRQRTGALWRGSMKSLRPQHSATSYSPYRNTLLALCHAPKSIICPLLTYLLIYHLLLPFERTLPIVRGVLWWCLQTAATVFHTQETCKARQGTGIISAPV